MCVSLPGVLNIVLDILSQEIESKLIVSVERLIVNCQRLNASEWEVVFSLDESQQAWLALPAPSVLFY